MPKRKRDDTHEQDSDLDDGGYSPSYVPTSLFRDYSPTSPRYMPTAEEGAEEGHEEGAEEGHQEEVEAGGQEERLQFPLCTDPILHRLNGEIDEQKMKIEVLKMEVDTLKDRGFRAEQEIDVRKRVIDIARLERILFQTLARRDELLKRKIDGLLNDWDYVFDRYSCPLEDKVKKPSRRPAGNGNLRKHGDKVYHSVYWLGFSVAHWGIGEPEEESGPKYTGCDCYL